PTLDTTLPNTTLSIHLPLEENHSAESGHITETPTNSQLTSSTKQANIDHQDLQSPNSSPIRFLPNNPYVEKELTDDHHAENILPHNQDMEYQTTKYSTDKGVDTSSPIVQMISSCINALGNNCFIDIDNAVFLNSRSNHYNVQQQDSDVHIETQSNVMVDEDPLTKSVFIAKRYGTIIVVQEAKVVKSNMIGLTLLKER
ncbi:26951_t:CDS:1, partial [Gigaspora margarita]